MWQRIKSFLKEHGTLVAGGAVGVLVAGYLVLRSKASSPTSAQITFPPSGGGGGSSGGGTSNTPTTPTTPPIIPTILSPIKLTLDQLQPIWHQIGVTTGGAWNYSQWASGIQSALPTGRSVPSNVLTYIWNTINTPDYAGNAQKALDFTNSTINDALANPNKYPASGTPVAPYTPPPAPKPPETSKTPFTANMPTIPIRWTGDQINSLVRVSK